MYLLCFDWPSVMYAKKTEHEALHFNPIGYNDTASKLISEITKLIRCEFTMNVKRY